MLLALSVNQMQRTSVQIQYEARHVRHRRAWICLAIIAAVSAFVFVRWCYPSLKVLQERWSLRQSVEGCLNYRLSPDTIVLAFQPPDSETLAADPRYERATVNDSKVIHVVPPL